MPGLARQLKCDELFLILLSKSGQYIASGGRNRASRKIAALGCIEPEAFERLLLHEVATHLR